MSPVTRLLLGWYYQSSGLPVETIADSVYWNTLSHLDAFFIGGCIQVFALNKKIKKPGVVFFVLLSLVIGAGGLNYLNTSVSLPYYQDLGFGVGRISNYEHVWYYTLLNLFFGALILLMVSDFAKKSFKKLRSILEMSWLVRIGKVSYSMYLFHWAVLVYIFRQHNYIGENLLSKVLFFIVYLAITYGIAELSFIFYESKFLALKDKFFPTKGLKRPNVAVLNN